MISSTFAADSMNSMRIGRCSASTSIFVVCIAWWAPKPAIARVAVAPDTSLCSRNVKMESHREPKWCCVSSLTKIVTFFAVPFWSMPVLPRPPAPGQHPPGRGGYVPQHNASHKVEHPGSTYGLRSQGFPRFLQPLQDRAELRRTLIGAALHRAFDRAKQFIKAPPHFSSELRSRIESTVSCFCRL